MLIQNTSLACVALDQNKLRDGFARENLFVVVNTPGGLLRAND